MSDTRQEIIDACAWMLWANAWISHQEELGAEGVNPGAGGSWDPYVPDVPETIGKLAREGIEMIERLNGATVDVLYERAIALPGKRYGKREPTPERFGNCLAYEALGAGVSWADDYPGHGLIIPHSEVNAWSDTEAEGYMSERLARRSR
jgi:hypothetical protein